MTPMEARNARAVTVGYANYYQQRLANVKEQHGQNVSVSQARGHPGAEQISVTTLGEVRHILNTEDKQAAFAYVRDKGIYISRDQWSLIFGSPTLSH